MKLTLRKFALAAVILAAGAMTAQVTVTQNWIKQGLPGANSVVRSGTALNGKCYLPADKELYAMDANGYTKVYTASFSINKGIAMDEAGNFIMPQWKVGGSNWDDVYLVKADFSSAQNISLEKPTSGSWTGGRTDNIGVAIGDFFSEEGGLFYLTANAQTIPMPVWFKNGQQHVTNATTATFPAANNMATAVPSVSSMADVTDANVANMFYYRTGSSWSSNNQKVPIYYVGTNGEAAQFPTTVGLPSGWYEKSQNGFAVFRLGGVMYQVRMAGPANWTNCWVLTNDQGEIVYTQNYINTDYAPNGSSGNGCNIISRQINPYKVELYQIYTTNTAAKGFCAMYTIEVPYIELNKSELNLIVDDEADLTASVGISTMEDKSVTWTSSNPDVATVDAAGHVTAVAPGTATITAKSNGNGLTATCEVTVSLRNPVTGLAFDKSELTIIKGFSETLTAIFTPEDAPIKTLTWTSSNPAVASVDAEGKVTAVEVGEATITATAHTGVTASCVVTVVPPVEVSEVILNKTELTLERGASETLTASVMPENATYPDVTWSSSEPSVASVSQDGLVSALKVGTAVITVTATNGVTATCNVTVEPNEVDKFYAKVTFTQNWIKQGLPGANKVVRSGTALNGKFYLPADKELYAMDANGYTKVYTASFSINKGIAMDEAGNFIMPQWKIGGSNWDDVYLVKADFSSAENISLEKPTSGSWTGGRTDNIGVAIGDFFSEEGGLFYMTANNQTAPMAVWFQNGKQHVTNGTSVAFPAVNTMATAQPAVSSMAEITDANVANQFYYRSGGNPTQIGYVNSAGNAAYLETPTGMPSGWEERGQNGFAVFTLDGVRLQVRMAGPAAWTNDWVVSDDQGNVVYAQNYTGDYAPTGYTGDGCNIIPRQINPYKVELYQIYTTNTAAKGFCAMYTIEMPHILLDKSELELIAGQSETLTYSLGTSQMEDKSITWTSSNPDVATVNEEGVVTAVGAGTATITATSNGNGLSASCEVTVTSIEVTGITLNKEEVELLEGDVVTLEAIITPEDATDQTVTWTSDNEEVATVNEEGLVTAVAVGTAVITATTSNDLTATCTIIVDRRPTGVDAVTVNGEVSIVAGEITAAPGVEVNVYDLAGRKVATTVGGKISGLPRGVYIVSVPGLAPLKMEI